jgi:hypothetical protein
VAGWACEKFARSASIVLFSKTIQIFLHVKSSTKKFGCFLSFSKNYPKKTVAVYI